MPNRYSISIPEHCSELWADMTPTQKGAYCQSCRKEVIDFTKLNDKEIINIFRNQSNTCGRFNASQLNRQLIPHQVQRSLADRLKSWIAACTLLVCSLSIQAKPNSNITPTEIIDIKKSAKPANEQTRVKPVQVIKGIVKDSEGPLPGAFIRIKGTSIDIQANAQGEFVLTVPNSLEKKKIILIATFLGYETREVKVNLSRTSDIRIIMYMDAAILGGLAVLKQKSGIFHSLFKRQA